MGYLDRDWYEGIVQKLKWNVPIRPETDAADIAMFTSRSLLRSKGVQGHSPVPLKAKNVAAGAVDGAETAVPEQQATSNGHSIDTPQDVPNSDTEVVGVGAEK